VIQQDRERVRLASLFGFSIAIVAFDPFAWSRVEPAVVLCSLLLRFTRWSDR
jgi:hypothetical protein